MVSLYYLSRHALDKLSHGFYILWLPFKYTFLNFGIILNLDLQRSCKDTVDNSYTSLIYFLAFNILCNHGAFIKTKKPFVLN